MIVLQPHGEEPVYVSYRVNHAHSSAPCPSCTSEASLQLQTYPLTSIHPSATRGIPAHASWT